MRPQRLPAANLSYVAMSISHRVRVRRVDEIWFPVYVFDFYMHPRT
jgi:hypothetical protein